MKPLLVVSVCVLVCACLVSAQQTPAMQTSADQQAAGQSPDRGPIETALKAYVSAYERRSMDELLAVWPDLQNQKKDFNKVKDHFEDGRISGVKVTLSPQEIQTSKDDALARCDRTEEYTKTETHIQNTGDTMMSNPAQRPPPSQSTTTKKEKKTNVVWFKLHKKGDDWQIVSVSEKPLSL